MRSEGGHSVQGKSVLQLEIQRQLVTDSKDDFMIKNIQSSILHAMRYSQPGKKNRQKLIQMSPIVRSPANRVIPSVSIPFRRAALRIRPSAVVTRAIRHAIRIRVQIQQMVVLLLVRFFIVAIARSGTRGHRSQRFHRHARGRTLGVIRWCHGPGRRGHRGRRSASATI